MSARTCYNCALHGHVARRYPNPLPPASEPKEEEDRSDTDDEDSLASRTVVQNLELLTTTLRTYLRDKIGIVRDGVLKQSAVVEYLVSAVRDTQLEMRGFKALMEAMSG